MAKFKKPSVYFVAGSLLIFLVIQGLISTGTLNDYWKGIIFWGGAITIVTLGLNLIYGFNGQFSLGQYGFYGIGAYGSAYVTYHWVRGDPAAMVVALFGSLLVIGLYAALAWGLRRFYGVTVKARFTFYLIITILGFWASVVVLVPLLGPMMWGFFAALPEAVAQPLVFFLALISGGMLAGITSFLFGLPVLELGSDYFGIATLGFTIIVKVLLDNTDTILPFPAMKGARGMLGIPRWTTWAWVFGTLFVVIVIMRNLLHSSVGRAIVSVREDERAAELVGIDVANAKILAFVLGSVFAGVAGGLRAHDITFLHPQSFHFIQSFNPLIIVVFGGLGSITGTVFTGFLWIVLLEGVLRLFLPSGYETWRFVIYPLILLMMMLLRPEGLFGTYELPFLRAAHVAKRQAIAQKPEEVPV